jgi:HEAT repeat protein
MGEEICFDIYLRSVIADCQKSMRLYTLMDDREQSQPDFFELKMQVVQQQPKHKEQSEQEGCKEENTEPPIPVIEIYKYAQDHVLLMGKAGSGKSTALQKLLSVKAKASLDKQNTLIPVLIELRSWQTSVIDLIKNFFRKHKLRLDIETIDDLLFDGRLLLLVDGINELPSDEARNNLEQFRDTNSGTPMIFTTRVLGVSRNLGIAKQMEMLPLSDREMSQFIEKCLPQQSEQLLKQLGDRLSKFGETPLLLSMLCDVFQKDGKIPANLGATFQNFTNLYDGKIKENIPVDEKYKSWTSELIQQIAFAMMPQDNPDGLRLEIPKFEAENILAKFLDDKKSDKPHDYAKQWLKNLLKYHLIQIKTDQTIEFRHQLIQEYYAAEYLWRILGDLSNEKLQKSYLNYLDWTESLALMLELVEEEQAVLVVRLALKVDLRLGARLAGAVKYEFQEKTVGLLIREIDEREIPQLYAIELLGKTRSESVTNLLIANLKDSDYDVRWDAAEALVNISDEKAVDALIIALKDSDYDIRWNAAEALINIGNEKAVDTLIIALKDSDSDVRSTAAVALGNIGSEKAVNALIIALKDSDSDVRSTAAEALSYILEAEVLGKIGNKKVVESLIIPLKDSDVWRDAAETLGKISNKKVVESLIISIKDSNYFVRRDAAEALGKLTEADLNLPTLTQQLPHLLTLIPTKSSQQALSVITTIQSRCKYYNYLIYDTPFQKESKSESIRTPVTINVHGDNATVIGNVEGNVNNHSKSTKPP